jgi:hypothetical protein
MDDIPGGKTELLDNPPVDRSAAGDLEGARIGAE